MNNKMQFDGTSASAGLANPLSRRAMKRPKAPIFVFIHGGAWRRGEAKNGRAALAMMQLPV